MRDKTDYITYLQRKDLANATQKAYCKSVDRFLEWFANDPINCTKKDVLHYLAYLKNNTPQQNITRRNSCIALNHYFTSLLQSGMMSENPLAFIKIRGTNKKQLHKIYTPDELTQLADDYHAFFVTSYDDRHLDGAKKHSSFLSRNRNYTMLTFLLYQGLTTRELPLIQIENIDLMKARLTLDNGKTKRNLPIQATQMGAIINYLNNIRPLAVEFFGETEQLFFSLSAEHYNQTFSKPLRQLTKQVKIIHPNFVNFSQTRASVITHWIQTEGLRKAQYLAGHKHIKSTENYLPNDLDSLKSDIQKFNPF